MKNLTLISFLAISAVQASDNFRDTLDTMQPSDLNSMSPLELSDFKNKIRLQQQSSAYTNGHGHYKNMIDTWDGHIRSKDRGCTLPDSPDAIPMTYRPMAGKSVVNMFKVTKNQLSAHPDIARQFYKELMDTTKSDSYKSQANTKRVADQWIDWLEDNGFDRNASAAVPSSASHYDTGRSYHAAPSNLATQYNPPRSNDDDYNTYYWVEYTDGDQLAQPLSAIKKVPYLYGLWKDGKLRRASKPN